MTKSDLLIVLVTQDTLIIVLHLSKVIFTGKYGSNISRVAQLFAKGSHFLRIEAVPDLLVSIDQTTHFVNCNVNCHSLKHQGSQVTNQRLDVSGHSIFETQTRVLLVQVSASHVPELWLIVV